MDAEGFFAKLVAQQHYQSGLAHEQRKGWAEALAAYRDACKGDPQVSLYWLARGTAAQHQRRWDEAAEAYREALALSPADPVVLYNQALLFLARGQREEARRNLDDALRLKSDQLGDRAALVHARLGDLALQDEDYAVAEAHLRQALARKPDDPYAEAARRAIPRLREFAAPYDQDGRLPAKIGVYAYCGAMLLGLPRDNGITIPAGRSGQLSGHSEVAGALRRLVDTVRAFQWHFDALVPLDTQSWPLVQAVAHTLGTHSVRWPQSLQGGSVCAMAVTVSEAGDTDHAARAAQEHSDAALLVSLGLRGRPWQVRPQPHVLCVPTAVTLPWADEAETGPEDQELGRTLADLVAQQPPDETADLQRAWYREHSRLR
ncbi:MAG: hypothetical protein CL878_00625, partial [Dehalococcoidia bacterium]|nr:hypothetical protein [Dehalococcoidia bacterium]